MKNVIKIMTIAAIVLFSVGIVSAALNSGLQAPAEFVHSEYWDKNSFMDIWCLPNDNNTRLDINKYDVETDGILFESDSSVEYSVTPMGNNIAMFTDGSGNSGGVMEVVEFNGEKYLVSAYLASESSPEKAKDCMKYLDEFNKLNNVEAIAYA